MAPRPFNPYEAPRQPADGGLEYRALGWLTHGASVGVLACAALSLLVGIGAFVMPHLHPKEHLALIIAYGLLTLVALVVRMGTAVAFLSWLYRAATNVWAFRRVGLSNSPAWVVGCWFVPFVSLFAPYQALAEIWRASDPGADGEWSKGRVPLLLPIWWGAYLARGVLVLYGSLVPRLAGHLPPNGGRGPGLVGIVFDVISAVAIVSVMKRLDRRQRASAATRALC